MTCCLISSQDLSVSKADVSNAEEGDILSDSNLSDHLLMTELSDVPPAQLLDGGSEDMEMVGCHDRARMRCNLIFVVQSDSEVMNEHHRGESLMYEIGVLDTRGWREGFAIDYLRLPNSNIRVAMA